MKRTPTTRQLYLIFILFSLFTGIIFSILILPGFRPYTMHPTRLKRNIPNATLAFHDFDNDGYSELIYIFTDNTKNMTNLLLNNFQEDPIDQFNLRGEVYFNSSAFRQWIFFADLNNDNWDEMLVFHQDGDSVFLSVIDVLHRNYIVESQFLLRREGKRGKFKDWIIYFNDKIVDDLDGDGQKELVFTIVSGYGQKPRGIFRYDFAEKRITHAYHTNASFTAIHTADLDGDNRKEILVSSYAGKNFPPDSAYSDAFSWLFAFDDTLNLLFPPKKFGGFTSGVRAYHTWYRNKNYIWALVTYGGISQEPGKSVLIDLNGNIIEQKELPFRVFSTTIYNIVDNQPILFASAVKYKTIALIQPLFHILRENEYDKSVWKVLRTDINNDLIPELVLVGKSEISILNNNLDFIGKHPIPEELRRTQYAFTIRKNGPQQYPYFVASVPEKTVILAIKPNILYPLRLFIPFLIALVTFGGLATLHKSASLFFIYTGFLFSYLKSTVNGVLLVDNRNRILSHNTRFTTLLNLDTPIKTKMKVEEALHTLPELLSHLRKVQKDQQEIQTMLTIKSGKTYREIKLYIKPLVAYLNLPVGYLIEIQNPEDTLGERTHVWAKTVQKLAHDIKAPLTSIRVGLKTLEIYIDQSALPNKTDVMKDVQTLRTEIERVHNITKNFLKFVNMEEPNFAIADIHHIIQRSIERYQGFFNNTEGIQLETQFDSSISPFYMDSQQMEMVFNILIENAIDAMGGQGTLSIQTNRIDDILKDNFPLCEIEITDSGKGLSPEELENIFNPFFTTKEHGTGLGLTIAKKIIEDHRGTITAYSKEHIGTTFRIVLPMRS